jgi:hypothetical protein
MTPEKKSKEGAHGGQSVGEPSSDSVAGSLNVRSPFCGWRVGQGPKTVPLILSFPLHQTAVTTPVMSL